MSAPEWLLWLDMETTGLWPEADGILEVACVLTRSDLETVWEYEWLVEPPRMAVDRMSDFVRRMHTDNGLLKADDHNAVSPRDVEVEIMWALSHHLGIKRGECVLAGNTIHFDRRFIARHMPYLHEYLHYRMLDVSAVRHALRLWSTRTADVEALMEEKDNQGNHRAMADVRASLEETKVYREWLRAL